MSSTTQNNEYESINPITEQTFSFQEASEPQLQENLIEVVDVSNNHPTSHKRKIEEIEVGVFDDENYKKTMIYRNKEIEEDAEYYFNWVSNLDVNSDSYISDLIFYLTCTPVTNNIYFKESFEPSEEGFESDEEES